MKSNGLFKKEMSLSLVRRMLIMVLVALSTGVGMSAPVTKEKGVTEKKIGESTYRGIWKDGALNYGVRVNKSSEYTGEFDSEMRNHGFGTVEYSSHFIKSKKKQGIPASKIPVKYVGNWSRDHKEGLGRTHYLDGSIEYGVYKDGIFQGNGNGKFKVGEKVYGIDVSHHQTNIDWDNLALYSDASGKVGKGNPDDRSILQPIFFVYIKATEGTTIQDETYAPRMEQAKRHGIVRGSYHLLSLKSSIEGQIDNFIKTASWSKGDLPPALDVENFTEAAIKDYGGEKKLLDAIHKWLKAVEKKMGVKPIIYSGSRMYDKYISKDKRLKGYDHWNTSYTQGPLDGHSIWQFSQSGRASGLGRNADVDLNLFNGDFAAFTKYVEKHH